MKIDKLSRWIKGQAAPRFNRPPVHRGVLRIIPIGGLEEVGKNAMILEYENDIIIVDMGFQFPEPDQLGVDYVIPDIEYLKSRKERIKGILVTHGHLDHIGAIPYVYEDLGRPTIYTSKLTAGLINKMLEEHNLAKRASFVIIDNKTPYRLGAFDVEFFRVNHSIPDSHGIHIRTREGAIVHTGDFKFDFTPADGVLSDISKMSVIGKQGLIALFSDSTNSTKPGHTISERVVGENLKSSIAKTSGRIVIAAFSSLIGRIQQIIDFAAEHDRFVFLSGRSMDENMAVAHKLGYLKIPKDIIKPIKDVNKYPDERVLIITTGSQGEPMSALSRMASDSHTHVKISKGDTVVVSASPIIGNEKAVAFLVDLLTRRGATVVHNKIMDVHTSGHGQQEDLKMMISLMRPKHLVPIHGNYYMRKIHASLGKELGMKDECLHVIDDGDVLEIRAGELKMKKENIKVNYVVVDGLGIGDLGSNVNKERQSMSQNGLVSIILKMKGGQLLGEPLVRVHGFVYQKETQKIIKEIEKEVKTALCKLQKKDPKARYSDIEAFVRSAVSGHILRRLDRRPIVSPVVVAI